MKQVDILARVRSLESTLARRFDSAARNFTRSGAREPLEIVHAILDAVDREIQPDGRGRSVFPFNAIQVSVLAPSREVKERLQTVLAGESGLQRRIADKLRSAGCVATDVSVSVSYSARAQPSWRDPEFNVRFAKANTLPETPIVSSVAPRIDISVAKGVAEKRSYSFAARRIDFGRCLEVKDTAGRLIRTNDVAFVEGSGDVNQSVSRQHAHIAPQAGSLEFRLFDDGSAQGTHILRHGRTLAVPRGSRGVRLISGDEILLGDARLRVRITP
jgi:FHA domain-containing protein